jgi:uncharacterized protein
VIAVDIAVTGSSGLIGSALVRDLRADGHRVLRLVRGEPRDSTEARWSPGGSVDTAALEGCDAVVHLAGAGIGDRRWSAGYKRKIRESRVAGTRTLATPLAGLDRPPRVLISASGVNWYGDTGDREVDESDPMGTGFLAEVVRDWEAAAEPATAAGIRVAATRSGVVIARQGVMERKLVPLFKLGLGGRVGSGRQWMSWISLTDHVAAIRFLIDHDDVSGPVNLTAPHPVTNRTYTATLARAVRRPAVFTAPAFGLRLALGGLADEALLISQRVRPARLTEAGFDFRYPHIDAALAAIL